MSERPAPYDPGLQPERTALAWRRTTLSVLVGAAVGARLLAPALGPAALLVGGAGVLGALALALAVGHRARRVDASLREVGDLSCAPGAGVLAAVAAACSSASLVALVLVVARAADR